MRSLGLWMALNVLFGSSASAMAGGQIVRMGTSYYDSTYIAEEPACEVDDGQTPLQWYARASRAWNSSSVPIKANDYLCALRAAEAGVPSGQTLLGEMLSHLRETDIGTYSAPSLRDPGMALYWFMKASDAGDARGAFEAGQLFEFGVGTTQSDSKAATQYRRASDLGYTPAKARLVALDSRPERIAKFEDRYLNKARAGDAKACFAIADGYAKGDPYAPDDVAALEWLKRAAGNGYGPAQARLGSYLLEGTSGAEFDEVAAMAWFIKAAHNGSHDFDSKLIRAFQDGSLTSDQASQVEQLANDGKLLNWLGQRVSAKSARKDVPTLKTPLGRLEVMTTAPIPDVSDFSKLTARAEHGDALAQYALGLAYLDGQGAPKDVSVARKWLEASAPQVSGADMILGDLAFEGVSGGSDLKEAGLWYSAAAVMDQVAGATNAIAIFSNPTSPGYSPEKAYALSIDLQGKSLSPKEAKANMSRIAKLATLISPELRTDGLLWLCELRLLHTLH